MKAWPSTSNPGHAGAERGLSIGTWRVGYRAVQVDVPLSFYARWMVEWQSLAGSNAGGELVSSVQECLAGVWPDLVAAVGLHAGLEPSNLDRVVGCYALESVADRSRFWREGWGSHRHALYTMLRMIVVFGDGIEDAFGPDGGYAKHAERCEGFGDFCRRVFRAQKGRRYDGAFCRLKIQFDCQDERFQGGSVDMECDHGSLEPYTRNCGKWANKKESQEGRRFDWDWSAWEDDSAWSDEKQVLRAVVEDGYKQSGPETGVGWGGIGGGYSMTLPPIQLAWVGFVCDRILHRARIVWDLYRYTGDPELAKRARELGRYALSVLCPMARVMIHEAGHTYTGGGGHCEFGGCFDIASKAWYCRVRGRLGLPPGAWDSGSIAGTWRGGRYYLDPADLARAWAADFGGTRHIVAEEADQCGTCDSIAREEWWLRTYLSAYAAVAGPPGLLPLDSIEWYSAARAFYQSRVDSARGACHLDWTCDLEAIGQPRGASTFCLQDAWAKFWLKDAEDVASYRDEWSFEGCRPVVTGEIDWRSHGTGGPGGGAR